MKRIAGIAAVIATFVCIGAAGARAGFFDDLATTVLGGGGTTGGGASGLDDGTIVKGLKEALSTGTTRAVKVVSQRDGYFGNEVIKILLPEKVRSTADLLSRFGFQKEVDEVVLGMNRAAEKAAPKATEHFVAALKAMTFDDARGILNGGNTAATDYFKRSTGQAIHSSFRPVISGSMQQVGLLKSYKSMNDSLATIPFAGSMASFDLEEYVTSRAVDGLFVMLGEEEKKIRTDPVARGTELLKKVFGR